MSDDVRDLIDSAVPPEAELLAVIDDQERRFEAIREILGQALDELDDLQR